MFSTAAFIGGLLLAVLLSACGSGSADEDSSSPTGPAVFPTAEGPLALDRFHYVASLTIREKTLDKRPEEVVISTEGVFQRPDRHAFTYTIELRGEPIERSAVIIGDEAWFSRGDDPWRKADADDSELVDLLSVAFSPIRPEFLGGEEYEEVLASVRRLPSTAVSVNGVSALRYNVRSEGREFFESFLHNQLLSQLVGQPRWQLWLAADGSWPVRLLATATITSELATVEDLSLEPPTAWELRVDISRANDPALAVVAPSTG